MGFYAIEVEWDKHPLYNMAWVDFIPVEDGQINYALISNLKKKGATIWGHTNDEYTPSRHLLS